LRQLILDGLESKPLQPVDATYWETKRKRLAKRA
jgi:hypothetical protein